MTDDPDELEDAEDWGPVFPARFDGECVCGADFSAGDLIRYGQGEIKALNCCGEDEG